MKYSIVFQNNSSNDGDVCVYQTDPDISNPNVMSVAWFAKHVFPTTKTIFTWSTDYCFVWSETGELVPGVMFIASQVWNADLQGSNKVTLTYEEDAYNFKDKGKGSKEGVLYIKEDGSIPMKKASVGIGMSGKGTFVVQAQPNINLDFTPHPKYWITFGNYSEGEVLDITQVTDPVEISFPPNIYSMTAILKEDNTWDLGSTAQANVKFIEARKKNSEAKWGMC